MIASKQAALPGLGAEPRPPPPAPTPPVEHRYRVVYTTAGRPTAAIIEGADAIIDTSQYWVPVETLDEAFYLAGIINSDRLFEAVEPLCEKGFAGGAIRNVHKHLWRLPIPKFDPADKLHVALSAAAHELAIDAACELRRLRLERRPPDDFGLYGAIVPQPPQPDISSNVARRELRAWLRESRAQELVEVLVGELFEREGME